MSATINPIISVQNGKPDMLEMVRIHKNPGCVWRSDNKGYWTGTIEKLFILHVNDAEAAGKFEIMLRDELDCPERMPLVDINPGLSVHTGAGLVGVCLVIDR